MVPSVLAQEMLEFDAIVRAVAEAMGPLPDNPARVRMLLTPDLARRLEAHCQAWQFLGYHGYGKRELTTLGQYVARLAAALKEQSTDLHRVA